MRVSIIIPVRAITPELHEAIPHLLALRPRPYEILIITDEPYDKKLSQYITIIPCEGNPAAKRDEGSRKARGDILAFLDDDAYPEVNWIAQALAHFQNKRVAAVGGPAITPNHDSLQAKASGAVLGSVLGTGFARMRYRSTGTVRPIDDWPTVNLFVRKDVFERIGGFDTAFWPGEDTKLCLSMIEKGYVILYDPNLICYHHRAKTIVGHIRQIARYGLHRGHFARIFPQTSRRISYAMPSVAGVGLLLLLTTAWFVPNSRTLTAILLSSILMLSVISAALAAFKQKQWQIIFLYPPLLLATHLFYGAAFLRGFFSPVLQRYTRMAR